jgi:hypothetical protein
VQSPKLISTPREQQAAPAPFAIVFSILLPIEVSSHSITRWLLVWNVDADVYVVLAAIMMSQSSQHLANP